MTRRSVLVPEEIQDAIYEHAPSWREADRKLALVKRVEMFDTALSYQITMRDPHRITNPIHPEA